MYSSLCLRFLALTSMKFLVVLNDMNAIFCPRHKGVEWLTLPTNESRDVLFVLNAIKINYLSAICLKRFWMENLCSTRLWAVREQVFPIVGIVADFPSHLVIWMCLEELSNRSLEWSAVHEKWFPGEICGMWLKNKRLQAVHMQISIVVSIDPLGLLELFPRMWL